MAEKGLRRRIWSSWVANLSELYLPLPCHESSTGLSILKVWAHLIMAAAFVCMSVAGWNPFCFTCAVCSLTSGSQKLTQPLGEWKGKKGWCLLTVFVFSLCSHGFPVWFPSCFDLPSTPFPSGLCTTFCACFASHWYEKGFWAFPHNSLSDWYQPASADVQTPLTLLWQRISVSSDRLLVLVCFPQYSFEGWKWSCGHSRW